MCVLCILVSIARPPQYVCIVLDFECILVNIARPPQYVCIVLDFE